MAEKEMPVGIKILSVLYFIGAAILIIVGLLMAIGAGFAGPLMEKIMPNEASAGAIVGAVMVILGVLFIGFGVLDIFIGRGLWKGQNWARIVAAIFAILGGLNALVGVFQSIFAASVSSIIWNLAWLAVHGFFAYYLLMNEEVKSAFSA